MMSNDPDWALYRTLLAVIDEGSLSGAARRLALTQPTVARHVDALEANLGADLFVRSQRGLLRTASGAPGAVEGTVRISASEVVGVEYMPRILARLRREHPALAIELALTDRVDDLLGRAVDIAVRMTEPTQGALLARRLPPVELGFHAHADYLARVGEPEDLGRYDVIGYDAETPALRAMAIRLAPLDRQGFALRTDSNLAQFAMIRAGLGIGICQIAVARRDPALVRILPEITLPLPLWIVMHEDLKTSARYRVVFDALVEGLSRLDG
jgi:DNA-binding transcriptional LysR family regulator